MCLGDSTTADGGGYSWPSQLEEILNRSDTGMKFSVINKGVPGVDTAYIVKHLEENINKYAPDMVITMMGLTDRETADVRVYKDIPMETYRLVKLLRKNIIDKIREMKIYKQEIMFKKAIEQNPKNDMAYFELGRCYIEQGKYDKAEEIFKKAIEQNPGNDNISFQLGCCYREQRRDDKAEEILKKAIEQNPKNDRAYLELGRCYLEQRKDDTAEEMFKKAIELNPGNDMAYLELGRCCREQRKYDKAEAILKKAMEQNSRGDNAYFVPDRAYFELERCYREQGKYEKVEAILKKAMDRNPGNDTAYSELALLYETTGKTKLAQEYHQKAEGIRLQRSLSVTRNNYHELKKILDKRGIKLVCVQYPMRSVELLKETLEPYKDVVFVDNEKLFKDALRQGNYGEYFKDGCAVDFGHGTPKGYKLLATNIANVVLREYFK